MKEDISRIREIAEQIEDSLRESIESSSVISEEIRGVRRELELRRKGQPGWCPKHGHTTLLWEKDKGWRCAECIQ